MHQVICTHSPFPLKSQWKPSAGTIASISTIPAIPTVRPSVFLMSRGCTHVSIEKSFSRLLKKAPNFVLGSIKSSTYPRGYASGFLSPAASLAAFLSSLQQPSYSPPTLQFMRAILSAAHSSRRRVADTSVGRSTTHLAGSGEARYSQEWLQALRSIGKLDVPENTL